MKKLATILMLIAAIIAGGATIEAKTTKKGKAKTSHSASSSMWHGNIPTAARLYKFFEGDTYDSQFSHRDYYSEDGMTYNNGVCEIEYWGSRVGAEVSVTVYDAASRNWLYNDIKNYIKKKNLSRYHDVTMEGNTIHWIIDSYK